MFSHVDDGLRTIVGSPADSFCQTSTLQALVRSGRRSTSPANSFPLQGLSKTDKSVYYPTTHITGQIDADNPSEAESGVFAFQPELDIALIEQN